jgi:hypothetical protein
MKCAVLCNGPSRSAYNPEKEYAYRIGCNIPWTKVDCTVILDPQMVKVLIKNNESLFSRISPKNNSSISRRKNISSEVSNAI